MPNWSEVLDEIRHSQIDLQRKVSDSQPLDVIRRKYLGELNKLTNRNVICYYSGWLQHPGKGASHIYDGDKSALMTAVHKLDHSVGLDLILHTPGGDLTAAESIVDYLRRMFKDDIRAIVPQIAMSAGTMLACASKSIVMGKQSNLGPIDPQLGGIPAHGVISEFDKAIEQIKRDPASAAAWHPILSQYHPTFLGECQHAIRLASEITKNWLQDIMFNGEENAADKAECVVAALNNHDDTMSHARHIHIDRAKEIGLKVEALEDNNDLQDKVLTVHHAYMHTFASSPTAKVIENHLGHAVFTNFDPQHA